MKKLITNFAKLCSFLSFLTFYLGAVGQTPMYSTGPSGTGGNTIPFSGSPVTSISPYRYQSLYLPGELGVTPTKHYITTIYIATSTVGSLTLTNFEVNIGQSMINTLPIGAWQTGLTNVRPASSFVTGSTTASGWLAIPLVTPFLYDPSLSLIVETKHTAATGTGFSIYTVSASGNRRLYNTNVNATAPTGTTASPLRYGLGIDLREFTTGTDNARVMELMEPKLFCAGNHDVKVKIGNKGTNVLSNVVVQWSVDNLMQNPFYLNSPIDTLYSPNASSDTILTLGNVSFAGPTRSIKVWTEYPNNTPDANYTDDTITVLVKAGLNGNYTIGGTSPDYASFADAVNDLHAFGVCGPVTFNVAPGMYAGQVRIRQVPGASAVNTITFDGGSAAATTLTYSASLTDSRHTVMLDGSKYIRLRNLTIQGTGSFGWPVHILGTASAPANNIIVSKCVIDLAASATSTNYAGIVINGINNAPTTGGRADSIIIDSNVINNGYYGVVGVGLTGNLSFDNQVTNNTFNEQAYNGLWLTYQNGIVITDNTIKGRPAGLTYGLYYANSVSSAPRFASIQRNSVTNILNYGIFLTGSNNTTGQAGQLVNNMVGGTFAGTTPSALVINTASYWNIYHNTINNTGAGTNTASAAMNVTTGTNLDVRNNVFAVTNPLSLGVVISATNPSSFIALDYNIYHKPDTSGGILDIGGILYPSTFKGSAGLNLNSSFLDPGFVNDSVLTTKSGCFNGANLSVMTDIKAQPRSATPDIGCYEFQTVANDLAVEAISAPAFPMSTGMNDVVVKLRNVGNNLITAASVSYVYNGSTVSGLWTGSLGVCDATTFTFDQGYQVNLLPSIEPLKVYTSNPNYLADGNFANDTVEIKVGSPLNGNYTIGGTAPDFVSVNAAVDALNAVGVSGPVQFNIRTGVYTENVLISSIQGASHTSPVIFRSEANHPDSVVVNYNATSAKDNFVFKLFNGSFVTLDGITITALNSTNARGIVFTGVSSYDTIQNCKINTVPSATTSNAIVGVMGDNLTVGNILIKNNVITGGSYNVNFAYVSESKLSTGPGKVVKNIVLEGNTLKGAGYSAAYFASHISSKFINNTVEITAPTNATVYAVQFANSDSAMVITGNKITATGLTATTLHGMRFSSSTGAVSEPGIVANNTIAVGTTGGITNGLYATTMVNYRFYNNSINTISTGATNYAVYLAFTNTSSNTEFRNNIYSNKSTTGYALFIQDPAYVNSDYNLLHSTGSGGLVYKNIATATGYANLNLYRAAFPSQEVNSIEYRAPFISSSNLAINTADSASWAINGRAIHTSNNTDINGNARSTAIINGAADIGAHEFTPTAAALLTTAVPAVPTAGTTQAFLLFGDTVAKITWDPFAAVPSALGLRFYSGEYAPNTNSSHYRTNCYWDVEENGIGFYTYGIDLYYKETMKGSIITEADMRLAKMHNTNPWTWYSGASSSVDPVRNILSASGLFDFSVFTGTDNLNPLPVTLARFNASAVGNDVYVSWNTANEKNASHFIVEASADGKMFTDAGKVDATGNSSALQAYTFVHVQAQQNLGGVAIAYYRLASVDRSGSIERSRIIPVTFGKPAGLEQASVYPNPFSNAVSLKMVSSTGGAATIVVNDIHGKKIMEPFSKKISEGANEVELNEINGLVPGVYVVTIFLNGESRTLKVVKQ